MGILVYHRDGEPTVLVLLQLWRCCLPWPRSGRPLWPIDAAGVSVGSCDVGFNFFRLSFHVTSFSRGFKFFRLSFQVTSFSRLRPVDSSARDGAVCRCHARDVFAWSACRVPQLSPGLDVVRRASGQGTRVASRASH